MREEWRCVSIGGGALSVVMDGHKPTLKWSVITLDMISLVGVYSINPQYAYASRDSLCLFVIICLIMMSYIFLRSGKLLH